MQCNFGRTFKRNMERFWQLLLTILLHDIRMYDEEVKYPLCVCPDLQFLSRMLDQIWQCSIRFHCLGKIKMNVCTSPYNFIASGQNQSKKFKIEKLTYFGMMCDLIEITQKVHISPFHSCVTFLCTVTNSNHLVFFFIFFFYSPQVLDVFNHGWVIRGHGFCLEGLSLFLANQSNSNEKNANGHEGRHKQRDTK